MKRLVKALKSNKQPRFIFHPRYIIPTLTGPLALHRTLFFLSCKKPKYLALNIYAYMRWLSITAWKLSYTATLKHHDKTEQSKCSLFFSLIKFALLHNIAPRYYFKYEFDKPQNKKQAFNYIYNAELPYFHDYSNQNFPHYKQAAKLIGNKHAFAEALYKLGFPTVQGKIYKTQDLRNQPSILYAKKALFCKPNNGSRSMDAFLIIYDKKKEQYHIKPVTQPDIHETHAIAAYLAQVFLRHNTLLIQNFIEDHPEIQVISQQEASTTVRIITEKLHPGPSSSAQLLYLQLEIPKEKQAQQFYTILPLALDSLDIDPIFKSKQRNNEPEAPYPVISEALKKELKQSIALCCQAHAQLLDTRSISFDVILSKTGPVILEANYNWSIEMLYHVINIRKPATHPAAYWLEHIILDN